MPYNPESAADRDTMNRLYDASLMYDRWIEPVEREWSDEFIRDQPTDTRYPESSR
jgi:hypothetical protein